MSTTRARGASTEWKRERRREKTSEEEEVVVVEVEKKTAKPIARLFFFSSSRRSIPFPKSVRWSSQMTSLSAPFNGERTLEGRQPEQQRDKENANSDARRASGASKKRIAFFGSRDEK